MIDIRLVIRPIGDAPFLVILAPEDEPRERLLLDPVHLPHDRQRERNLSNGASRL